MGIASQEAEFEINSRLPSWKIISMGGCGFQSIILIRESQTEFTIEALTDRSWCKEGEGGGRKEGVGGWTKLNNISKSQ